MWCYTFRKKGRLVIRVKPGLILTSQTSPPPGPAVTMVHSTNVWGQLILMLMGVGKVVIRQK